MKALILGGTGFIGAHLSRILIEQNSGIDLTVVDNGFRSEDDAYVRKLVDSGVRVIWSDLADPDSFGQLDSHYDVVVLLAAVVGVGYAQHQASMVWRVNTAIVFNTLEWTKTASIGRLVYASTSECYAGSIEIFNFAVPTNESVPPCIPDSLQPRFSYAITKLLGESGVASYAKEFGYEFVILRYHNIYGPRMGFSHVVPQVVKRFHEGENPFLVYGADHTRAFCYVADAAEATRRSMFTANLSGEIIHVGNPEEVTIETLITSVGEIVGFGGSYEHAPAHTGSVPRRCPDVGKMKSKLGYSPQHDLKSGLEETVRWYEDFYANKGGAAH